jgi:hypothetical protein
MCSESALLSKGTTILNSVLHVGMLSCLEIKHVREWQLKSYMEANNNFLAFHHCDFRKRLWFVVLWLCPALVDGIRIVSISAVSFDFLQLLYEHANRFFIYPILLNTCVPKTNYPRKTLL